MGGEIGFVGNNSEECSQKLDGLPFTMCLSTILVNSNHTDTVLSFKREETTDDAVNGGESLYSEHIKEIIDYGFEHYRFHYNVDADWDEIEIIEHQESSPWTKKCNHRLLIATICVEEFDVNHHRASIKMREWNQQRIISSEQSLPML